MYALTCWAPSLVLKASITLPLASCEVLHTSADMSSLPLAGSLKKSDSNLSNLLVRVVTSVEVNEEALSVFFREIKISFSCASVEVAGLADRGRKAPDGPLATLA